MSGVSTGCATRQPMLATDLNSFSIDCRIKEQQIRMLQSMRVSKDDQNINKLAMVFQPWHVITSPDQMYQQQEIQSGRTNWLINQNLLRLSHNCP